MRVPSESIQPAQPLRECPYAARLRNQVFRIDIRADLQGLRCDHDQMASSVAACVASRSHAVLSVEDPRADSFGLPFAREPGQEQYVGRCLRHRLAQAAEGLPGRLRGVREHHARRRAHCVPDEVERRIRQTSSAVNPGSNPQLQRLYSIEPLSNYRVRFVFVVETERSPVGIIAGCRERHQASSRSGLAEDGLCPGRAIGKCGEQRPQMWRQMRFIQQDQAVGSGHGGIDRTQCRSVAAKQQP